MLTLWASSALAQAGSKPDSAGMDFSGILFANYQYQTDETAGSANRFDVERA
jgi:hypothetical protein